MQQTLGDAAGQQSNEGSVPASSNHDHRRPLLASGVGDHLRGTADICPRQFQVGRHTIGAELRYLALDLSFNSSSLAYRE